MEKNFKKANYKKLLSLVLLSDTELIRYIENNYKTVSNIEINAETISFSTEDFPVPDQTQLDHLDDLTQQNEDEKVIDLATGILEDSPNHKGLSLILSKVYLKKQNNDFALKYALNALKWNLNDTDVLAFIGKLMYKQKDINSAMQYWSEAIKNDDYRALIDVSNFLLENNDYESSIGFSEKALDINPESSEALFSMSQSLAKTEKYIESFDYLVKCLKSNPSKDIETSISNILTETAEKAVESNQLLIEEEFLEFKSVIERSFGTSICIVDNIEIEEPVQLRIADYIDIYHYEIRVKPNTPYKYHLLMQKLYHLYFIEIERFQNIHRIFKVGEMELNRFNDQHKYFSDRLVKRGLNEFFVEKHMKQIFKKLCNDLYNTTYDLFIEHQISSHKNYAPLQFLSLRNIMINKLDDTKNYDELNMMPKELIEKSKTLNFLHIILFRQLYGMQKEQLNWLIILYEITQKQHLRSENFYEEFEDYLYDKDTGEEYSLIELWAEDLELDYMFNFEKEVPLTNTCEDYIFN